MSAHEFLAIGGKGGHSRHALSPGLCPIGIDLIAEAPFLEYFASDNGGQSDRFSQRDEQAKIPDILSVHEIGSEQSVVDCLTSGLSFRPRAQLLGQAAVVGVGPHTVGQALLIRQAFEARIHGADVPATSGKHVFQRPPFGGRFRMQGKVHPADGDIKCLFQSFNTPGTEVTPGSDVVAEDFEGDGCSHRCSFQAVIKDPIPITRNPTPASVCNSGSLT